VDLRTVGGWKLGGGIAGDIKVNCVEHVGMVGG
jgi:hypothetical protein